MLSNPPKLFERVMELCHEDAGTSLTLWGSPGSWPPQGPEL